jgi:hypothetical protein
MIRYVLELVFGWHAMLGGGEPPVHWTASYVDATGAHIVEAWRQPDHVRRVTDRTLELDAVRPRGDGYRFAINDRARGVTRYASERDRISAGSFDDWQRWTHVIAPVRPGALVFALARPTESTVAGPCRWLQVDVREVCWSRRFALPLRIRAGGRDVYVVTSADRFHGELPAFAPIGSELPADDD